MIAVPALQGSNAIWGADLSALQLSVVQSTGNGLNPARCNRDIHSTHRKSKQVLDLAHCSLTQRGVSSASAMSGSVTSPILDNPYPLN